MQNRIKMLRKSLKLTQTEFAEKLGITIRGVQKWESGSVNIKPSSIKLICTTFNVNPSWLETGAGDMFIDNNTNINSSLVSIPYYQDISINNAGELVYNKDTVKYLQISSDIININTNNNICLISAVGDAMHPVIDDGDLLVIDLDQKTFANESIYVIYMDNTLLVKRIQKIPNAIILISDNAKYTPITISTDTFNNNNIIGKIIAIIKKFNKNNLV